MYIYIYVHIYIHMYIYIHICIYIYIYRQRLQDMVPGAAACITSHVRTRYVTHMHQWVISHLGINKSCHRVSRAPAGHSFVRR